MFFLGGYNVDIHKPWEEKIFFAKGCAVEASQKITKLILLLSFLSSLFLNRGSSYDVPIWGVVRPSYLLTILKIFLFTKSALRISYPLIV
jgi:hypothetical protein